MGMQNMDRQTNRNIVYTLILLSCLALLNVFPAMAQDDDGIKQATEAERAFDRGEYSQASLLAESQLNYELAIKAALVHGGYYARDEAEAMEWLERAHGLCDIALAIDASHMRNRLSLALVLSYKAKKSQSVGLVMQAKRIIEKLILEYPDEAMSHGSLAGWNSQISAAGFLPRLFLGASRKKARRYFKKALFLDETNLPLNLEYAKYLARGGKKERKMAEKALSALLEAELHNAFERLLHDNARAILIAVQTGKKKRIKQVIKERSAFPDF